MAYQKPQAIIHQQFETIPNISEDELRAVIVGPSAILHRYADADEKINIFVGIVDPVNDTVYPYPARSAGGIVDESYSKLYVDNALLSYFNSLDHTVDDEGIQRVVTGKSDTQVYVSVTISDDVQTLDDTDITATTITEGTPVRLLKYARDGKKLLYVKESATGGTTENPTDADLYDSEDTTSFKHSFEFALNDENEPIYINAAGDGITTEVSAALTVGSDGKYPAYIFNKEEGIPEYTFYSPFKYDNAIVSDTFKFAAATAPRNGALGVRDVTIGDYALIWTSVKNTGGNCVNAGPQLSRIIGLVAVEADPVVDTEGFKIIQPSTSKASPGQWKEFINPATSDDYVTDGNCTLITPYSGEYSIDPFKYGILNEDNILQCTYKVTVSQVYTSGNCKGVVSVNIRSDETGENHSEDLKAGSSNVITLSENGYGDTGFWCSEEQIAAIRDYLTAAPDAVIYWEYSVTSAYRALSQADITIGGLTGANGYKGPSDTYIFEVTDGKVPVEGDTSANSKFTVNTAYGRENVRNATLTADAWEDGGIALGTQGLTIKFAVKAEQADDVATTTEDEYLPPFNATTGLPASFKLYIPIIADKTDAYNGILLADNVDTKMRPDTDGDKIYVNLRLLYNDNIILPAISPADGRTNWYQEVTSFVLNENATTTDSAFINYDGTSIPLTLFGFGNIKDTEYDRFSKIYFNYREWSPVHAKEVTLCESVSALDNIIGQLDPDNPLKYAVYKALMNSNGASVGYVAVKDPDDIDDWQDAVSTIEGRDDVYTIVPLTTDVKVQNLVLTLVNAESAAEACRWKTALFNMDLPTEVMRVGFSKNNNTTPTSTDGKLTTCKIVENPLVSGKTVYNKLVCTSGNAKFLDYGVVSGDEVRLLNSDGSVKATFTVDQIYSNGTLTLMQSLNGPSTDDEFEIWHTYTRSEEVNVIRARAQSVASRRVGLVWPDIVEEGGVELPGYYLSAALAGLKSGVEPQNGLTRRTIQGFDGFTRSKPRYTESQLDLMAGSGVWICVTDSDGTPQSRHALNTDTTNSFYSEEMMTRNFDSVSKYMYQVIDTYIGTSNVTDETLQAIYSNLRVACDYLIGKGQMIDYTRIVVKQHDLLLDRVLAYLDVGLPFAVNNVELFITAEAYELNAVTLESEVE